MMLLMLHDVRLLDRYRSARDVSDTKLRILCCQEILTSLQRIEIKSERRPDQEEDMTRLD